MSVVAINALTVPEPARPELEKRFAERKHSVDDAPGFEGFQLLRPVAGGDQYFVYTYWPTLRAFENWRAKIMPAHEYLGMNPVTEAENLLEFEVVDLDGRPSPQPGPSRDSEVSRGSEEGRATEVE